MKNVIQVFIALIIGLFAGLFILDHYAAKDYCGHTYSLTPISVGFEEPREYKFEFDFPAAGLFNELQTIDGVVGGFTSVDQYTFYVKFCPQCDLSQIKNEVKNHIAGYMTNKYCHSR